MKLSANKFILITASILAMSCSPVTNQTASAHDGTASHDIMGQGKLYVSATGQAVQAPDRASVSAGVVTQAATAGEAMRANAKQMNAAFKALKAAGIKDRNITTSQMSLQPQYDYQNRKAPRITGYEVRNTVSAMSDDLDKVGSMLDALVSAGVNNINGVTFSIKDAKSARAKARMDAIAQARTKAENMAKAAGVRLGKVLEIREGGWSAPPPQPMMMARSMDMESSTPVAAGEQTLSVTVNIIFALEQ
ncbi:MAG: SIMPL domain-containing protein [Robiginitomaculum sp.]|nr:SIMPL domain-containing protein [Robiginitomaculum sp.]